MKSFERKKERHILKTCSYLIFTVINSFNIIFPIFVYKRNCYSILLIVEEVVRVEEEEDVDDDDNDCCVDSENDFCDKCLIVMLDADNFIFEAHN